MRAVIESIGAYAPPRRVSNDEFAKIVDTTDEWIVSHTGIRFRHIAADDQAASDMAIEAGKLAMGRAGVEPGDIDLVIVSSASSDYPGFPATACIVQDKLGLRKAGAMDLLAGCTGFIYGLETAKNYIVSGSAKKILVIGAETLTRIMDWTDRNTCVLFGDGAGAAVVGASESDSRGIIDSILRAEGSGAELLDRPAGGSRMPFKAGETDPSELYIKMDGGKVYIFAVRVIVTTIKAILEQNNLTIDDIKYIVPHQANIRIIEAAAKRSKIPLEKFYMNIQEFANTSAASIPIALNEMVEKNLLKKGDKIITVGFGAGLTYGANLIVW
ncbi:MAG: 3-oxoacyl-ACP synthase [Spirochaetes bacterium]|nr:MAG: 3-oxoacyl-ACP synthase [Spirochaetota bacterium]